jgi:CubicO group peptidase (beta-lactamase class C family)
MFKTQMGCNCWTRELLLTRAQRHLLTHTAGTAYDAADPNLIKYQSQQKQQQQDSPFAGKGTTVPSRFSYPLIFHPGSQWSYGSGLDWAGLLIERLTTSTLEAFMKTNIWDPLDLQTMTFFPSQKGGNLQTRIPELSIRGPDGALHPFREPFINDGMTACAGGQGAYSSMGDYAGFLRHLLRNDGTILRRESVDELFESQLTAQQAASMKEYFAGPRGAFFIGEFDLERYEHGFSFGGVVFAQGYEDGRRAAGSVSWGGVANCFWVLDRGTGVALSFGTQVVPPGDKGVEGVITAVETGVYGMVGAVGAEEARL